MASPINWIQDHNRFKLAGPPDWWLRSLYEFDNSLVVLPSRMGFYYRLAQRRKLNLSEKAAHEGMREQGDSQMLQSYSLVPVTTILATANWSNPYLFEELRRRAPWRMGGAEKVEAQLRQQEQQDEMDKRARTDAHLTDVSKDAWKYYQMKQGLRSNLYSPATKNGSRASAQAPGLKVGQPSSQSPTNGVNGSQRPQISTIWVP